MPDRRKHRGAHPEDADLFSDAQLPPLKLAVEELSWLVDRDYPREASLKLVGDRHALRARQRTAVSRCVCSGTERDSRLSRQVEAHGVTGQELWIDGFNVLTTVESVLGGGVLLRGRDGCVRDMASMHGSYRMMADTEEALRLIFGTLVTMNPKRVVWYLDQPVSNSGRLKAIIRDLAATQSDLSQDVELVPDPDPVLIEAPSRTVIASADSGILDRCAAWVDLVSLCLRDSSVETEVLDLNLSTH